MESSNGSGYRHTQNTMDFYFFFHFISASYTSWICHNGLEIREDSMVFFFVFLFFGKVPSLQAAPCLQETCNILLIKKSQLFPKLKSFTPGLLKKWKLSARINLGSSAL